VPQLRFLDSARDNLVEIAGYIAAFGGEDVATRFNLVWAGQLLVAKRFLSALHNKNSCLPHKSREIV
jgi:hypothetical protein